MRRTFLVFMLLLLAGASSASASPLYATWEAESMGGTAAPNEVLTDSAGATYVRWGANGSIYATGSMVNAGRLRVRARSSCASQPAVLTIKQFGTQVLFQKQVTNSWAWYDSDTSFVLNPGFGPSATVTAAITVEQADYDAACPRRLSVDKIEWYRDWRPFSLASPYNVLAASKGTAVPNTYPSSDFLSYNSALVFGGIGTSHDRDYNKPVCNATPSSPAFGVAFKYGWHAVGNVAWDGSPVPLPSGCSAAAGSDGHLTIYNPDRTTIWDFWECSSSGVPCSSSSVPGWGHFITGNLSQWDAHGLGVATCCDNPTGRGSGTSVAATTLTANDATYGFSHALSLTVPDAACPPNYDYPAVKSDGDNDGVCSGSELRYGQLFVLKPSYVCPSAIGPANVCAALKTYGAYIADQGASLEIDTTGEEAAFTAVGLAKNSLPLVPSDLLCVDRTDSPC